MARTMTVSETSMPTFDARPLSSAAARSLGSSATRAPPFTRKGFLGTGDEEDEADIRVGDNVLDRVEVIVARSIGNEQGLVVEDLRDCGTFRSTPTARPSLTCRLIFEQTREFSATRDIGTV
jgi:hypothetical protein